MKERCLINLVEVVIYLMMSYLSDSLTTLLPALAGGLQVLKEIINFNLLPLSPITEALQNSLILICSPKNLDNNQIPFINTSPLGFAIRAFLYLALKIKSHQFPNMYTVNDLILFVKDLSCESEISASTDIFDETGLVGDDFHEMMAKYSEKYSVDLSSYLWYFHTDEEGNSIGASFFKPPQDRVTRIPVTPKMLTDFANKGRWDLAYPTHSIPKKRYDLLINRIFVISIIGLMVFTWCSKCTR